MQFLSSHLWKAGNASLEIGVLCLSEGRIQSRKLQQDSGLLAACMSHLLYCLGKILTRFQVKSWNMQLIWSQSNRISFKKGEQNKKQETTGHVPLLLSLFFFFFNYFRTIWGHLNIWRSGLMWPQKQKKKKKSFDSARVKCSLFLKTVKNEVVRTITAHKMLHDREPCIFPVQLSFPLLCLFQSSPK